MTREEVSQKGKTINPDDDVDLREMIKNVSGAGRIAPWFNELDEVEHDAEHERLPEPTMMYDDQEEVLDEIQSMRKTSKALIANSRVKMELNNHVGLQIQLQVQKWKKLRRVKWNWASKETYQFVRVTFTKIHCIKMIHIWRHIS